MTKAYPLRFISDPGHGWLEVPILELAQLGIAADISSCSYISAGMTHVYLEEDCDAGVFFRAKDWTNQDVAANIIEVYKDPCWIRDMQSFNGKHFAEHVQIVDVPA